jgi:hypothetical protein
MPLTNFLTNRKNKITGLLKRTMNVGSFICAMMVVAQIMTPIFGSVGAPVLNIFGIKPVMAAPGINKTIAYQGKLMSKTGSLVADGDYQIKFSLYDSATGGSQLWTASSTNGLPTETPVAISVSVKAGLFSIYLGDISADQIPFPDNIFNNSSLYLAIAVGSDSEMTPRKRITAVPYAYNTEALHGQYASGSSLGSDGNLFALTQASSSSAYTTRTALFIQSQGLDDTWDYLLRANDSTNDVFTVSRQGHVTTTGNFQTGNTSIIGNATSVRSVFNSYIQSDTNPYVDNAYSLGVSDYRWKQLSAVGVSSTNIDALNYVSSSVFYLAGHNIYQYFKQHGNEMGEPAVLGTNDNNMLSIELNNVIWGQLTTTGQFGIRGPYNIGSNAAGYKLLINNYGTSVYPIFVEDEDKQIDFYIKSPDIEGENSLAYMQGDVSVSHHVATEGLDRTLTVTAQKNAGINLISDALNTDSNGNPYIYLTQDGNLVWSIVGLSTADDFDPRDVAYGGVLANTFLLGHRHNASHLQLGTNNIVRMTIDPSGTIGIGTNTPQFPLAVAKTSADKDVMLVQGSSTSAVGNTSTIAFKTNSGNGTDSLSARITAYEQENHNADLLFAVAYGNGTATTSTNEAMRIRYNGNVGIGDSSPESMFTVGNGDLFQIDASGNIVRINNVTSSWPLLQPGGTRYLKNTGTGQYTWALWTVSNIPNWQEVTNVGNTTDNWILFFGASSTNNLNPTDHNSYDLGLPAYAWRNIYVSSTAYINNIVANIVTAINASSTNTDVSNYVSTTNLFAYSSYLTNVTTTNIYNSGTVSTTQLYVNGVAVTGIEEQDLQSVTNLGPITTNKIQFAGATSSGTILPSLNLTYNLGSSTNRWKDIWAKNIYLGTSTARLQQDVFGSFVMENLTTNLDEFNNNSIESYWTTSTPSGTITESGEHLNIVCTGTCDWWSGALEASPIIYQPISNSDFTVTTKIDSYTAGANSNAGITLYRDRNNAINWIRRPTGLNAWRIVSDAAADIAGTSASVTNLPIWLRVNRVDSIVYFEYSINGIDFITVGQYTIPFIPTNAGLLGKTWSGSTINVTFDYFELMDAKQAKINSLGSLMPSANNLQDIGSQSQAWQNLYSSNINTKTLNITPNASAMSIATSVNFGSDGIPLGLAVEGEYAYIGEVDSNTFKIISITDPASPIEIGSLDTSYAQLGKIMVNGDYAYVNVGTRIIIIDITDKANPFIAGTSPVLTSGDLSYDLFVKGDYAFFPDLQNNEVDVVNIANPTNIFVATSVAVTDASAITGSGNHVYTITKDTNNQPLSIINISDPANAYLVGSYSTGLASDDYPISMQVLDANLYIHGQDYFVVVNVSKPSSPVVTDVISTSAGSLSKPQSISASHNYIYTLSTDGIMVIDASDKNNTSVITEKYVAANLQSLAVKGKYAYVMDSLRNLHIVDLGGINTHAINAHIAYISNLAVTDHANFAQNVAFGGKLTVNRGGIYNPGKLHVIRAANFYSTSTLEDIQVNGRVNSNLLPNLNLTYDLGSSDYRWRDLWASSTRIGTSTWDIWQSNTGLTFSKNDLSDIYLTITNSGHVLPGTDNTQDLGTDSNVWKNIYAGNTVYSHDYWAQKINAKNPSTASVTQLASITIPSPLCHGGGAVQSNYYYHVCGGNGSQFRIVDVSDPSKPEYISFTTLATYSYAVKIKGEYAYVGNGNGDIHIIDISQPSAPSIIRTVDSGASQQVFHDVNGNYLYYPDAAVNRLEIYDISNPAQTSNTPIGTVLTQGASPRNVVVQGDYAYVANYNTASVISVINISNPTVPVVVATTAIDANPTGLAVQDGYLFVTHNGLNTMDIVDITNPTAPTVINKFNYGSTMGAGYAQGITVQGRYVYLLKAGGGMAIVDISDPLNPYLAAAPATTSNGAGGIAVSGRYIYTNTYNGSTFIVHDMGGLNTNGLLADSLKTGGLQVLGNANIGQSLNIEEGAQVGAQGINSVGKITGHRDLYIIGNSYLSDMLSNQHNTFDLGASTNRWNTTYIDTADLEKLSSKPINFTTLYQLNNSADRDGVMAVKIVGKYLYMVLGNNVSNLGVTGENFQILDISDPSNPIYIGGLNFGSVLTDDIVISGNYAYISGLDLTASNFEIIAVDISNPASPQITHGVHAAHVVYEMLIVENYLYAVTNGGGGQDLYVYDISDPSTLVRKGGVTLGTNTYNSTYALDLLYDKYLVVGGMNSNIYSNQDLFIFDISNPISPVYVSGVNITTSYCRSIKVRGSYIYAGTNNSGTSNRELFIIDASSVTSPVIVSSFDLGTSSDYVEDILLIDDYAYTLQRNGYLGNEVSVLDISSSTNPFYVTGIDLGNKNNASQMDVSGDTLVVGVYGALAGTLEDLFILDMGGVKSQTVEIGTVSSNNLNIYRDVKIGNNLYVKNDLYGHHIYTANYSGNDYFGQYGDFEYLTANKVSTYATNPTWASYVNTGGTALNTVYKHGDYAYIGGTNLTTGPRITDDFQIFDVSDPYRPRFLGGIDVGGAVDEIVVRGDYAYIVRRVASNNLQIYDISNPRAPVLRGQITLYTGTYVTANALDVVGNYAYVGVNDNASTELKIVDVSNASSPVLVGGFDYTTTVGNLFYAIKVVDNIAYLGVTNSSVYGNQDFILVDVSDPYNPTYLSGYNIGTSAVQDISIVGKYAYLGTTAGTTSSQDLIIMDISSSTNPVYVNGYDLSQGITSLDVVGDYAYVASRQGYNTEQDLIIINVSDPSNLRISGSLDLLIGIPFSDLDVSGRFIYAVGLNSTYQSSNADFLILENKSLQTVSANIGTYSGEQLYVGQGASFNNNVSIADSLSVGNYGIKTLGSFSIGAGSLFTGLMQTSNVRPLADITYDLGSTSHNWRNLYSDELTALPSQLDLQSIITPTGDVLNIGINGGYLYSLEDGNSLNVYDVHNPTAPASIGLLALIDDPFTMAVSGDYAYLSGSASSVIQVISLSDPANPSLQSTFTTGVPDSAYDSYVSGKYLYVSYGSTTDAMYIYNIEDPNNLVIEGNTASFTGDAKGLAVHGKYAYIVEIGSDSLHIFDISDPSSPTLQGSVAFGSDPYDVAVNGSRAYVAVNDNIHVVDISDPANPAILASLPTSGNRSLHITDNYLYSGGTANLYTIDVASSTSPIIVDTINSVGTINDIKVSGRSLFAGRANTDEIRIYDVKGAYINGLVANSATVGSLQVMTDARFNNKVDISGGLTVGARGIYTNGTLSVLGNSILLGNVGIGTNNPNNFKLQVAGHVGPDSNDAYDIGSDSYRFKDVYLSGTLSTQPNTAIRIGGHDVGSANPVYSTFVKNNYLYVGTKDENITGRSEDFQIYDITDPNHPVYVSGLSIGTGYPVNSVRIVGHYAYLAYMEGGNAGLWIYDISDPHNITFQDRILHSPACDLEPTSLSVHGKNAYMVGADSLGDQYLFIYDIYDPEQITLVNYISLSGDLNDSAVIARNGYLLVGGSNFVDFGNRDLLIFKIDDPENPNLMGSLNIGSGAITSIYISNKYAYLGSTDNNAYIVNFTNPSIPVLSSTINVGSNAVQDVKILDDYLFVGTQNSGTGSVNDVLVYNISSSTNVGAPVMEIDVGSNSVREMAVSGKKLIIATLNATQGSEDWQIYDLGGIKAQSADIGSIKTNLMRTTGDAYLGDKLFVSNGLYSDWGGIQTPGALSAGSTSTLSNIQLSGRVNSHLLPYIDNTYDLGSATYRWRNLQAVTGNLVSLHVYNPFLDTNTFLQHGNEFGETAVLGTNDARSLSFETGNNTKNTIDISGNFYPAGSAINSMGSDINRWSEAWSGRYHVGENISYWSLSRTVNGNFALHSGGTAPYMQIATSTINNIFVGNNAGWQMVSGSSNVAIGGNAMRVLEYGNENTAIGDSAFRTFISGNYNTAFGAKALYGSNSDQTAHYNTGIGAYSLYGLNTGASNTAVGFESLRNITNGYYNTAVGLQASRANTTGAANTALGSLALSSNQTGSFNTALGAAALFSNVSGDDNIAIGYNALYGNKASNNTALGKNSLYSNTTGEYNIAVGPNALHTHTNGFYNIAIGESSSYYLASGNDNTAVGDQSMLGFLGGNFNTAIGAKALKGVDYGSTASHNTGIGAYSLHTLSTGASNTAVGYGSLFSNEAGYRNTALGTMSLSSNVDGFSNVAIGHQALQYATSSLYSIAIGDRAGLYSYGNFNIAIGNGALTENNYAQNNIGIGFYALNINNVGINNVIIGNGAGQFISSNNNVALGRGALNGGIAYATGQANTAIGNSSIFAITTGSTNTAVGINSLFMNSSGSFNSVLGGEAMFNNTTGNSNVAIGSESLYSNQTGNYNIAVGRLALNANTTSSNLAIGYRSQFKVISGSYNVSLGNFSLQGNETGTLNTMIGYRSGSGVSGNSHSENTALGAYSLYSITTGNYNTALGVRALYSNNIGGSNIAIGYEAMVSSTQANTNIAIGNQALSSIISSSTNVAIGHSALSKYLGDSATAVGHEALYYSGSSDAGNSALGWRAAYNTGKSGPALDNTALGYMALYGNDYGDNNTAIGAGARYLGSAISDSVAIGTDALFIGGSNGAVAVGKDSGYPLTGADDYFTGVGYRAGYDARADHLTFVGYEAGRRNVEGQSNTAIGAHSLWYNDDGSYNTALGQGSLYSMIKGSYNTALGAHAGFYQDDFTFYNTLIGYKANYGNATLGSNGDYNTAVGANTLEDNMYGHRNVAIGAVALADITTGSFNTVLGTDGMRSATGAASSTAFGFEAIYHNTSGHFNTAFGHNTLKGVSGNSHSYNTAVGALALDSITTGGKNNALGYGSLNNLTSASDNSGFGYGTLAQLTTGANNIGLGYEAGLYTNAGNNNVGLGYRAFYGSSGNNSSGNVAIGAYALDSTQSSAQENVAIGAFALDNVTTGDYNVGIGRSSGGGHQSGYGGTFLGYSTDATVSSLNNITAIGYDAYVTTSDSIRIGNSSVGSIGGYQPWSNVSDARLKQNVVDTDLGLDFINKLRPVKFEFIHSPGIMNDGFIAQEVKSAMDQLGKSFSGLDDHEFNQGGYYYLEYGTFVTPLVRAVQQISASSSMLWNGIEVDPSFASLGESFLSVDLDGNLMHKGSTIKAQNIASSSTQAFGSYTFSFMGSSWNPETSQEITTSFRLQNNTISATSSEFNLIFATGTAFGQSILTITDLGDVKTTGDLYVGKRLFLGSKTTGGSSTSTYIFVDDTLGAGATYIATNADGWQADTSYDYAERYQSSDLLEPGDLVIADKEGINKVKRSTSSQDIVLGIVSTKPGFITGGPEPDSYPIALAGRVPTKVSTINGAIQVGDFLSPSDIPGVAVKSIGKGSVIGVALESYDKTEQGLISVFVNVGYMGNKFALNDASDSSSQDIKGFAFMKAGSQEVKVSHESVLAYPIIRLFPQGDFTGQCWTEEVTDVGFTIKFSEPQLEPMPISYIVTLPNVESVAVSDGSPGLLDTLTGQVIFQ